jgi:hypothetical protein
MSMKRPTCRGLVAWLPPVAAWLAVSGGVLAVSAHEGWPPFAVTRTWVRWDSVRYLSIARSGYDLFPCRPPTYAPGTWCGNAGWFPAYPWIAGGLERLHLPLAASALALSWLALLGTLVLLWREFLVGRRRLAGLIGLAYAALAPGLVYDYAVFPLSMLCLFTVASFALLQRGRWLAAGVAGALAALSYPVGLAFAPASLVWLLAQRGLPVAERLRRSALVALPTPAAVALFALDQRAETGRWNAYLLVQQKYGHGLEDPFAALLSDAEGVVHGSAFHLSGAPALQSLLVALVLVCVLADRLLRRVPAASVPAASLDTLIALWALAAWLVPHVWANVSVYRGEAALLPVAVLVARLPRPLSACLAGAALLLVVPMQLLYERSLLV